MIRMIIGVYESDSAARKPHYLSTQIQPGYEPWLTKRDIAFVYKKLPRKNDCKRISLLNYLAPELRIGEKGVYGC